MFSVYAGAPGIVEACLKTVLEGPKNKFVERPYKIGGLEAESHYKPPLNSLLQNALNPQLHTATSCLVKELVTNRNLPLQAKLTNSGVNIMRESTPPRLPLAPYDRRRDLRNKPHKCTCGRAYRYKRGLNAHQKYECGRTEKAFTCWECAKKFTHQSSLNSHVRIIHKGEDSE